MDTKAIESLLVNYNKGRKYPLSFNQFVDSCKRYINATKRRNMICSIQSVAPSGMSRVLYFFEIRNGNMLQFDSLFEILGYTPVKNGTGFRVNGCGMDMVFNTNYEIIYALHQLKIITRKTRDTLCQQTPHKV